MKYLKVLFVFALVLLFNNTVDAQNRTVYDALMQGGNTLREYRGKAVDTLGIGKTTFTYTFFIHANEAVGSYYEIALDSISGTAASTAVAFQSRKNIFTTWATDSTVNWSGTTSDTTIVYYDTLQTVDPYRRILVTYTSDFKIKVDWLSGLFIRD